MKTLKQFIKDNYGKEYCGELKAGKKSENTQAGHEGIRCIDLNMTNVEDPDEQPFAPVVSILGDKESINFYNYI